MDEENLTPDTVLQLAPNVRTRFDAGGHVLVDAPDGTIVDIGPRGYAILSLSRPDGRRRVTRRRLRLVWRA